MKSATTKETSVKVHTITSSNGKVYEVRKLRSAESFNLSTWHYRREGDRDWRDLRVDTLTEARKELNA